MPHVQPKTGQDMRRSICSRTIVAFLSHVLVSLLVVLCAQVEAQNLVVSGATFLDGDTFVYNRASKVRLAGIDTPEIGHDGAPDQYYAEASRKIAAEIAGKATLVLVPVGAGKDRHGRGLCDVRLPDGRSLNEVLVEKGSAYVYYHDDVPQALQARLLAAQRRAMDARAGFWKVVLESFPAGEYVGNRNSHRFFSPGCAEGRRVASRNRVYFSTAEDAFRAGFSPARPCNIWPAVRNVRTGGV